MSGVKPRLPHCYAVLLALRIIIRPQLPASLPPLLLPSIAYPPCHQSIKELEM